MAQRTIEYNEGGTRLKGVVTTPETKAKAPGVLIAHDWSGLNEFAEQMASRLAEQGYVGFAIDMYGEGRLGTTVEEKSKLMAPVKDDRALLMRRVNAGFEAMLAQPEVDGKRTGAIGFCFGGLVVLDLARSGADVGGVVSFHGFLDAPDKSLCKPIKAQVLALHGYQDPMVTPDSLPPFQKEMSDAGVDFQLHIYGRAKHAFTNPAANDPKLGTVYDELSRRRALRSMDGFFADLFA